MWIGMEILSENRLHRRSCMTKVWLTALYVSRLPYCVFPVLLLHLLLKCKVLFAVSEHGDKASVWSTDQSGNGCDITSNIRVPWSGCWWFQFAWFGRDRWRHKARMTSLILASVLFLWQCYVCQWVPFPTELRARFSKRWVNFKIWGFKPGC